MKKSIKLITFLCMLVTILTLGTTVAYADDASDYKKSKYDEYDVEIDKESKQTFNIDNKNIMVKYVFITDAVAPVDGIGKSVPIKDIAKAFSKTSKKFNFKFDADKNELNISTNTVHNTKDTGARVLNNKFEKFWGTKGVAYNRKTKVYCDGKKVDGLVYIYKNTLFMHINDIAKCINSNISYNTKTKKVVLSSKKDYSEVTLLTPLEKNVDYGTSGLIKCPYEDAKAITSPKTKEDFASLFRYMFVSGMSTCTFQIPSSKYSLEESASYQAIKGGLETVFDTYSYDVYKSSISNYNVTETGNEIGCKVTINFVGYGNEENVKKVAEMNKKYHTKIKSVLQGLIDNGKITKDMNETQKAYAVFMWVSNNVKADKKEESKDCHSGYAALIEGKSVCDGYASLYTLMCRYLGLYNTCAVGGETTKNGINHAWVCQILDGKTVVTDPTHGKTYFATSSKGWCKYYVWGEGTPSWCKKEKVSDFDHVALIRSISPELSDYTESQPE